LKGSVVQLSTVC